MKIVVLQSSHSGFMSCREQLESLGLVMGKDFTLVSDNFCIEREWDRGKRQLFVTGSLWGNPTGVAEMVQKAKDANPELVTMCFALQPIHGPFDHVIEKSRDSHNAFREAVQGFLNGSINRKTQVRPV